MLLISNALLILARHSQDRGVCLELIGQTFALSFALSTAHFKDIGKIRIELE
jgi:hypothetical protein